MNASRRRRRIAALAALPALAALAWATLVPVEFASREELFEIPAGTWSRRMAGDAVDILPSEIHLTLGIRDVLLLRNLDHVPQIFGPTLLMPGQSLRLPFAVAAEHQFECTAHASGQMTVVVAPEPRGPLGRLRWRLARLWRALP